MISTRRKKSIIFGSVIVFLFSRLGQEESIVLKCRPGWILEFISRIVNRRLFATDSRRLFVFISAVVRKLLLLLLLCTIKLSSSGFMSSVLCASNLRCFCCAILLLFRLTRPPADVVTDALDILRRSLVFRVNLFDMMIMIPCLQIRSISLIIVIVSYCIKRSFGTALPTMIDNAL